MRTRKVCSQVFEEIKTDIETERSKALENIAVKISLKDINPEERIQEASKPLYLKRYE